MLAVLILLLTPILPVLCRKITVVNSCSTTIWPGMHTGAGDTPAQVTGWKLGGGEQTQFVVPEDWTAGRIWARTGCIITSAGAFQCLSGGCGSGAGGDMTWSVDFVIWRVQKADD